MAKKSFKQDIATGADRFFSVHDAEEDTRDTQSMQNTRGVSHTAEVDEVYREPRRGAWTQADAAPKPYRINLKLDPGLKEYLADEAWRNRISMTELINRMIRAYRDGQR